MISAYRKAIGAKTIAKVKRYGTIEPGLTPLFLLDGNLPANTLDKAVKTLQLPAYVAIYRPFDVSIKRRFEDVYKKARCCGFLKKDDSVAEWVMEHKVKIERIREEHGIDYGMAAIQGYLDYEKARKDYTAVIGTRSIDASVGEAIAGDLNDYLFNRAKSMYPIGIENVLESNLKQSAIPKYGFFMDGLENRHPPKGVRVRPDSKQITLFTFGCVSITDTIDELRLYFRQRIEQDGAVNLRETIEHCAEIGLYKGNITLYAIGAAFQDFVRDDAVFYDGVCYFRYAEVLDIAPQILAQYDSNARRLKKGTLFFDGTGLKERLESIFGIDSPQRRDVDTFGMAIVQAGRWVVEHLRYPIAFVDNMLYRLFRDDCLYGVKLQEYAEYFTAERCEYIRTRIPYADDIARQAIQDAVGFDPDKQEHAMSNLPKGHYAPVLYSAEDYIEEIRKEPPPWAQKRINAASANN
jgi:hypothetical protein